MTNNSINKSILKHIPNYYKIINEEFNEEDIISEKIIQLYQEFVFTINPNKKEEVKTLIAFNEAIERYFKDRDFRGDLREVFTTLKVNKRITNVLNYIVKNIIIAYDRYKEGYTRNLYVPKWI